MAALLASHCWCIGAGGRRHYEVHCECMPWCPHWLPTSSLVGDQPLGSIPPLQSNDALPLCPSACLRAASLMQTYTGTSLAEVQRRIQWNIDDPNLLEMSLPGGLQVGWTYLAGSAGCCGAGCWRGWRSLWRCSEHGCGRSNAGSGRRSNRPAGSPAGTGSGPCGERAYRRVPRRCPRASCGAARRGRATTG